MTPLETAKKLAAASFGYSVTLGDGDADGSFCVVCDNYVSHHEPDCPVPMLPQIAAALEKVEDAIHMLDVLYLAHFREDAPAVLGLADRVHVALLESIGLNGMLHKAVIATALHTNPEKGEPA